MFSIPLSDVPTIKFRTDDEGTADETDVVKFMVEIKKLNDEVIRKHVTLFI